MVVTIYYWPHNAGHWGHSSMSLSGGTYISWWPSHSVDENKDGALATVFGAIFEFIAPIEDMTFEDDEKNEGIHPTETVILKDGILDENAIVTWWMDFKTTNDYNGMNLNCSTVVWLGLKAGGALDYVNDPKPLYWAPNLIMLVAKGIIKGKEESRIIDINFYDLPDEL